MPDHAKAGRDACQDAREARRNPHPPGTDAAAEWAAGFEAERLRGMTPGERAAEWGIVGGVVLTVALALAQVAGWIW